VGVGGDVVVWVGGRSEDWWLLCKGKWKKDKKGVSVMV
jgi:hypothetical protein